MSETLLTAGDNVRWLTGDRDPANYVHSSIAVYQHLIDQAQRLGNKAGLGMTWSASAFTLTAGSNADYTLPAADALNLVALRIAATGRMLYPLSRDLIDALRDGITASSGGQGDPQWYAAWESATQLTTIRIDTVPNVARAIDVLRAVNVTTAYTDAATLPSNESFLRVIEKATARALMLKALPAERERIGLNIDILADWDREVNEGVLLERERMARIKRAPYAVGAILGQ